MLGRHMEFHRPTSVYKLEFKQYLHIAQAIDGSLALCENSIHVVGVQLAKFRPMLTGQRLIMPTMFSSGFRFHRCNKSLVLYHTLCSLLR